MCDHLPMGPYYGYPKCCIDYFFSEGYDLYKYPNPLLGTGYVPCKDCCNKSKEELITIINSNRFCKKPFPNCEGTVIKKNGELYKHFEKFMQQYCN